MIKKIFFCIGLLITLNTNAQYAAGDIGWMDHQRIEQLIDSAKMPERSFAIRSTCQFWNRQLAEPVTPKSKLKIQLVQAGYTMQNNTDMSIGYNDGSMYPAAGMQQRFTIGAHIQWRRLSLQLQPELVTAGNKEPVGFKADPADGNYWAKYYLYIVNKIDDFNRFGTMPISKIFPGQSSFRYNTNYVSAGVSTENLWWGPGMRNSLVLTNHAPGFLHLTLNSVKPIPTMMGNIEFQVVMGNLPDSTPESPDNVVMRNIWPGGIAKKPTQQRGLLGYIFSWNPKWTPNLHIGITGMNYYYKGAVETKPSVLLLDWENKQSTASLGALFFRYAMPKEQAEVYFEYGRADRLATPFNILGDTIPTGYTAGFRKVFLFSNRKAGAIQVGAEITQLQLPDGRLIFNRDGIFGIPKTNSWYMHPFISQGYTNEAQVMGASIGPGSNSQTFYISWIKGWKKIGLQAERIAHNNDFYYYNYFNGMTGAGDANKYWADVNFGLQVQWDYKQLLFSVSAMYSSALNYRWVKLDGGFADPSPLSDRRSTQLSCSLTYFFKKNPGSLSK